VLAQIAGVLGQNDISISSVYQRAQHDRKDQATIVIITHRACEEDIQTALAAIDKMALITQTTQLIRIEDED
jgi:homoserine dehydrogenase